MFVKQKEGKMGLAKEGDLEIGSMEIGRIRLR
jgi:hypothetical protein